MTSPQRVDLNAARKARAEKDAAQPVVILGDKEFTLPAGLPASVLVGLGRFNRGEMDGFQEALDGLFGDRTNEALAVGLEVEDLNLIAEQAYGEQLGEASASAS